MKLLGFAQIGSSSVHLKEFVQNWNIDPACSWNRKTSIKLNYVIADNWDLQKKNQIFK